MLDGIPPAPRGMPQVEVTFDVDANGILSVRAKDKTSGKEQSIRIEARSSLSKDDIERMQKDAEMNAEEDKKKQEEVEVKNIAESTIYTAEKALRDNGDKIPADIKTDVEAKIGELKTAKDGTDIEATKKSTEALSLAMQHIGEAMAKQQSTQTGADQENAAQTSQTESSEGGDAPEGEAPKGTVHDV
jgi:molecular chaperone DnaK